MFTSSKLALLRDNKNFRYLFIGQMVSLFGTMVSNVALPYQIYHETQSTFIVGLLSLTQLIPLLFTALWGGVIADRHDRKKLLIICESILLLFCLALAWNAYQAKPNLILIFVLAGTLSAITGLHRPALDSIKQQIIAPKDFIRAAALSGMMYGLSVIGGPAVGGLIIAYFDLPITYLVDALTFVIALISIILLDNVPKPEHETLQSVWSSLREGIEFAFKKKELFGSYLVDFVAMVCCMPMVLFPAIAQITGGGAATLGLLYASPAIGALTVSLFSAPLEKFNRHGAAIALSAAGWAFSILFFGFFSYSSLIISLPFLMLAGAFDQASGIYRGTLWNEVIPTQFRARLAGIEMISYMSGPKLGDTQMGFMASLIGIPFAITVGATLSLVSISLACKKLPDFWHYRSKVH